MFHPDIIGADASFIGAPTLAAPATSRRGRLFTPEKAVYKAHKALAVLDGIPEGESLGVREISQKSGLTTRDLGRIMNRLSAAARVSRAKDDDAKNGYFRYWVNEEQRKRFRAEFRASRVVGNMRIRSTGDARLDELADTYARLLTSKQDIESEKVRLSEEIARVRMQLDEGLNELDDAKALLARERRQLGEVQRAIKRQRECAGKTKQNHVGALSRLGDLVVKRQEQTSPSDKPALGRMDPVALAATLRFVQQLRKRPALADVAQLANIEADYQNALDAARGDDD